MSGYKVTFPDERELDDDWGRRIRTIAFVEPTDERMEEYEQAVARLNELRDAGLLGEDVYSGTYRISKPKTEVVPEYDETRYEWAERMIGRLFQGEEPPADLSKRVSVGDFRAFMALLATIQEEERRASGDLPPRPEGSHVLRDLLGV